MSSSCFRAGDLVSGHVTSGAGVSPGVTPGVVSVPVAGVAVGVCRRWWGRLSADGGLLGRVSRCVVVGVVTSVVRYVLLVGLVFSGVLPAVWAVGVSSLMLVWPTFVWNKRWVWKFEGPADLRRQVVPYWVVSVVSLVVTSVFVRFAEGVVDGVVSGPSVRDAVLLLVEFVFASVLWVVKFVWLDRVVFAVLNGLDRDVS